MNSWSYTLLFPAQERLPSITIGEILRLAEARGYSPRNPATGFIRGIYKGGLEEFNFDNLDETIALLSNDGGLLTLWKNEIDISITINQRNSWLNPLIKGFPLPNGQDFSTLSIDVEELFWKRDFQQREEIAISIKQLFGDLAELLNAFYGYSADEDIFEAFMQDLSSDNDLHTQSWPMILFWLQYFTSSYAAYIDQRVFAGINGNIEVLSKGVIISFFDYPWNVDINELTALNARWRVGKS